MVTPNPEKAVEFFEAKLQFTTGPIELNSMITTGENIKIIDVRAAEDYEQGHIPGAHNLPKDKWDTFSGLGKDATNIVYCYTEVCHLAALAARFFAQHGYPVMELQGGFAEWRNNQLPVEVPEKQAV